MYLLNGPKPDKLPITFKDASMQDKKQHTFQVEHGVFYELSLRPVQEPQEVYVLSEARVLPASSLEAGHITRTDDAHAEVGLHSPVTARSRWKQ